MRMCFNGLARLSGCRALVFVVHGAAEHCGGYDDVAQTLMKRNLLVFAHDHGEHIALKP